VTNSNGEWGDTVSADTLIDDIRRMMRDLPKPDVFLSTKLFPASNAMMVEGAQEKFTVAHPMFWARFEYETRKDQLAEINPLRAGLSPFVGIPIIEIDRREDDTSERRAYIDGLWKRLVEALSTAMVPLPEWLKAAPKFGEHG
jgi:hypothetical protein